MTAVYTKGVAIPANQPTSSGGAVTSFSVAPVLPAGLSLSTSTGTISGTPMTVTPTASYIVTASNSGGSITATLIITVNDQAPAGLQYTTSVAVYTLEKQIPVNSPQSTGGAVASYSVSPTLPAGLSLDPSSGQITGVPTAVTAMASYTVTATNPSGNTTVALTITVMAPPPSAQLIPNLNQLLTPQAPFDSRFEPLIPGAKVLPEYPDWQAGQAVSTAVSPDGTTLLVLTSGFNRIYNTPALDPYFGASDGYNLDMTAYDYQNSEEYVFIYDITNGPPVQQQVVTVPNSYNGIVWDPHTNPAGKNDVFYVSGGINDYPFVNVNGKLTLLAPADLSQAGYASQGGNPDDVHVFQLASGTWAEQPQLLLNHVTGNSLDAGLQPAGTPVNGILAVLPTAAGLAISTDGLKLAAANYANDSITVFTRADINGNWGVGVDVDLRVGDGTAQTMGSPGGTYPFWAVIQGTGANATAYVSSMRDREIDVVSLGTSPMKVTARIPVKGSPFKMTMDKTQTHLFVAEDNSDTIDVIDIASDSKKNTVLESIPVLAPPDIIKTYSVLQIYKGANTNSVTLSPDETQLYVTDGNLNAVAVVQLNGSYTGDQVVGLIPTGWYPHSVSFGPKTNSPNGNWVYVVNGKSPTGPNAGLCYSAGPSAKHPGCFPSQEYNPQRLKAGLQTFPQPTAAQLTTLTAQTVTNNHFSAVESQSDAAVMAAVHQGVQHVIFIIKENRSYDQILGDLEVGNGDPSLTEFGAANTPNLHNLASTFVTLDNIMASSEVSNDGWPWTTSGRATDAIERQYLLAYSGRGFSIDSEGENRNVNVAIPTLAGRLQADSLTRKDGNILPGTADAAAPDGYGLDQDDKEAEYIGQGYLWDAAKRKGLSIRSYGFFIDTEQYGCPYPTDSTPSSTPPTAGVTPNCIPLLPTPFTSGNPTGKIYGDAPLPPPTVMATSTSVTLTPFTDPYYRGFDNQYPDYYRYQEWLRDFKASYVNGGLPALSLVRLMHDHTGNFNDPGGFGLNTPERQQADNDYAVGLLVQTIANSPVYKNNTLVFVIEDDSQDAGDHVDSHRTVAFVAGAYVKQHALVSTAYTTINFLRTIEEVLGLPPNNINDALASPMADIFNTTPAAWSFSAAPSGYLYCSGVNLTTPPLPTAPAGVGCPETAQSASAAYWIRATRGMDFSSEDRFDFARYNRVLWKGIMGARPYPGRPTGKDLRQNREKLLAHYHRSQMSRPRQTAKLTN